MTVPAYIAAVALGSSGPNVGPTSGIDTTGATALRAVVITQSSTTPTVSDSKTNSWTTDRAAVQLNVPFTGWVHFFRSTTTNVGTVHTFSAAGATACSIWVIATGPSAGGSLTLTAFDAIADPSSPYASNGITPANADALLICFGASDGGGSPVTTTWQNGETTRGDVTDHNNFWGGAIATRAVTSSGTYAASFTDNSSGPSNAVVAILAVTESGGGTPVGLAVENDAALALSAAGAPAGVAIENDTALALAGLNLGQDGDLFLFGDDSGNESSMGGLRLFGGFIDAGAAAPTGLSAETDTAVPRGAARPAGLTAETDAALALAARQVRSVGLAATTDTTQALAAVQVRAVGVSVETENALALLPGATGAVGLATELDTALPRGSARPASLASETETALAPQAVSIRTVGLAAENDTAFARAVARPAVTAAESDAALSLGAGASSSVGMAAETDTALPRGASRPATTAAETEVAFAPTSIQIRAVGLAVETDAAFALTGAAGSSTGLASEIDTALPRGSARPVGRAADGNTALGLAASLIRSAGLAAEVDVALALAGLARRGVGVTVEIDAALQLFTPGAVPVGRAQETDEAIALQAVAMPQGRRSTVNGSAQTPRTPSNTLSRRMPSTLRRK